MKKLSAILLVLFALALSGAAFADNASCFFDDEYLDEIIKNPQQGDGSDNDCYVNCLKMMDIVQENCAARIGKKWDSDECQDEGMEFFIKCTELSCD